MSSGFLQLIVNTEAVQIPANLMILQKSHSLLLFVHRDT